MTFTALGAERYEQLLTLILTLRRPQLAKNLDPVKLSGTLTDGLRPVDDDLIIRDVEAVTDHAPFPICAGITGNYARLKGLSIKPGFHLKVRELLGGVEG